MSYCISCVWDVVSTGIQSVWIVRDRLNCAPVASPVWCRQGCLCPAFCQKYSHDISASNARCTEWKGSLYNKYKHCNQLSLLYV